MKLKICLMGLLCLFFRLYAQKPDLPTPLSVGDQLPDLTLSRLNNYPAKTLRLANLKGKLVILDFWATWCGSCLRQFPHLDSLAGRYDKHIAIILVNPKFTRDDQAKIEYTLAQRPKLKHLAVAAEDTACEPYFRFTSLPHYVWIAPDGKICAITDQFQVNETNIKKIINGERVQLPLKPDH